MHLLRILPAIALALFIGGHAIHAEQIRLADGRFLQGDVTEIKEDGFTFKLTETGGKVFLRWNQVDEGLKKRLTNQKDPDDGLNLEVTVPGARLELVDGTVYEGKIAQTNDGYSVVNLDNTRGRSIPETDVIEDGYITDIQIDATIVLESERVLEVAEEQRSPVETPPQYYELARIADRLALYAKAKEYVALALAGSPDSKLQARLAEYETQLDELLRQQVVLDMLSEAREYARKDKFQLAINILDEAESSLEPTGPVLDKLNDTRDEIDFQFTEWVIDEWYGKMKPVARDKAKEDNVTVVEAMNWARRGMDVEIQERLAEEVGSDDPGDIRRRFDERFDLADADKLRLRKQRVSFGKSGFYQVVGGHLPVAGREPEARDDSGHRSAEDTRRRFPRRRGDDDGLPDNDDGFGFQDKEGGGIELPDGVSAEDIKEIMRRALGKNGDEEESENDAPSIGKQDISHLEVPKYVPSLTDWWDDASSSTRAKWLVAVYVKNGGVMRIFEYDDWNIEFK